MRLSTWIVEFGMPRAAQGALIRRTQEYRFSFSLCSEGLISKVHGYVLILTSGRAEMHCGRRGLHVVNNDEVGLAATPVGLS